MRFFYETACFHFFSIEANIHETCLAIFSAKYDFSAGNIGLFAKRICFFSKMVKLTASAKSNPKEKTAAFLLRSSHLFNHLIQQDLEKMAQALPL
jgi:hypothetical protein